MRSTCTRTKRPRGALLQPYIDARCWMKSLGRRLWTRLVRVGGVNSGILPFWCFVSNHYSNSGTVYGGQFDWGGCLRKSNASAQRSTQSGWISDEECIGISRLYCEEDTPSSYESRSKWPYSGVWCRYCSTKISYPGDNRLVAPDSSYWRRGSAPRCRLVTSWVWISTQGLECSSIKVAVSWVQTGVSQVGLYPVQALHTWGNWPLVREDQGSVTSGVPVVLPRALLGS